MSREKLSPGPIALDRDSVNLPLSRFLVAVSTPESIDSLLDAGVSVIGTNMVSRKAVCNPNYYVGVKDQLGVQRFIKTLEELDAEDPLPAGSWFNVAFQGWPGHTNEAMKLIGFLSRQPFVRHVVTGRIPPSAIVHQILSGATHCRVGYGSQADELAELGISQPTVDEIKTEWRAQPFMFEDNRLVMDIDPKSPGDVVRALRAGADLVVLDSYLLDTVENYAESLYSKARVENGVGFLEPSRLTDTPPNQTILQKVLSLSEMVEEAACFLGSI